MYTVHYMLHGKKIVINVSPFILFFLHNIYLQVSYILYIYSNQMAKDKKKQIALMV